MVFEENSDLSQEISMQKWFVLSLIMVLAVLNSLILKWSTPITMLPATLFFVCFTSFTSVIIDHRMVLFLENSWMSYLFGCLGLVA